MKPSRILFAGGGSGGHILPAVAVAQEIMEQRPGSAILFATSEKPLDAKILSAYPFDADPVPAPKLPAHRSGWPRFGLEMTAAVAGAIRRVRRFSPDVVVGTGAYASVPTVLAAKLLGKPIVLMEPNTVPGRATRFLGQFAETIVCSHQGTARRLSPRPVRVLGTPIRRQIELACRQEACEYFQLDPKLKTLLVLGGSQGSSAVNRLVTAALPALLKEGLALNIIHQTGPQDQREVAAEYRLFNLQAQVLPYIEKIDLALAAADVAVSRAGAITIAEMTARNIPSVLIPLPHAVENDQLRNAQYMEEQGAARLVLEDSQARKRLAGTLHELFNGGGLAKSMALNIDKIAHPHARSDVARLILDHTDPAPQQPNEAS